MAKTARDVLALLVIITAGNVQAQPACAYHEEAEEVAAVSQDSVTLLAVDPPDGAELRKDMILAVDVQVRIAKFQPDTYLVVAMFPTAGFGAMSPGDPGNTPMLEHASAKVHLCVPLQRVYEHPDMIFPLSMRAQLLAMISNRNSTGNVRSREVKFKSPDAPQSSARLPDEYYDALKRTTSYFDNRAVLYKVCIARFPAMQPPLTKSYRVWEARHRTDIDFVSELQFERFKASTQGRAEHAAGIADAVSAGARKFYAELPAATLKHECEMKLEEFTDPDDNTDLVIGDELAILRKHARESAAGGQ